MPPSQIDKAAAFRALHFRQGAFVMPNPWDAGTARLLASLGFEALATTSAGVAFSTGRRDIAAELTRDVVLDNARTIVAATDLPVSADLQNGFGDGPAECADTIRMAIEAGLVGGSIEDATGTPDRPQYDIAEATDRVAAAADAARGQPFVLTARAENYLTGNPDLDDTIARLEAYAAAGAEVLYAPALPDLDAIRTVCATVDRPVNVVMGLRPPFYSVEDLASAGVRRISVGGAMARTAYGAVLAAAREIQEDGTFGFAEAAAGGPELMRLMARRPA